MQKKSIQKIKNAVCCATLFALPLVTIPIYGQQIKYTSSTDTWNANKLGNHRVVVNFTGKGNVAKATIEWRRRDNNPDLKKLIIIDAKSGNEVTNVKASTITKESGTIYFEPTSGKGTYYVYYLPYIDEGNAPYPKGFYQKPENKSSENWLKSIKSNITDNCTVTEIESVNAFNSFYPMEVIATKAETNALVAKSANSSFLIFPEDRLHSIKMKDELPQRWIDKSVTNTFSDTALRGEYFTFQLGVYALQNLSDVKVTFSDLVMPSGAVIKSSALSCVNTDGITYDAKVFTNTVAVSKGTVQSMWCSLTVPSDANAGTYTGTATITANGEKKIVNLNITIDNKVAKEGGINEPEKMTRLHWLNSTLAQENTVIAPYTALTVKNNEVSLLGRKVLINSNGFPSQIQTYFTPELTKIGTKANNVLTAPMDFIITSNGKPENLKVSNQSLKFTEKSDGKVVWESTSSSANIEMAVTGALEFDGFLSYIVKVTALKDASFDNMNINIPMAPTSSKYMMGLGQKGGNRPENFDWKWDVANKNQDGAWIGNVNAGLQFSLRDENYSRPLNTNFYLQKPLLLPKSWGNDNKGGVKIASSAAAVNVNAYSGARAMKKGETLYYNFTVLITPFHTIDTDAQWTSRYFHKYDAIDTIAKSGANIVNIHHANPINPYINYPFIEHEKMKSFIDQAHQKGLKVKIYNTVREVSNKAYETFALKSLGHEIYSPGKGGGFSWLQEHLGDDYIAAWFVADIKDAAIVNSGMNRWHNYYVEGMNWLTKNVGIDGIYLDDVAFDRITMKRIKRVLTNDGHPGLIDLHSANQFNIKDGYNNSANLYLEHFPYINKLWFGEYFDYEKGQPEFYLTEVSGIPFGLMGEMLQDGGNPWRGMIYGMTNRLPWSDNADPRAIWKLWDEFGIKGSDMIGYWSENCPVKTSNSQVLATVYKKDNASLISIASWAESDVEVNLAIDWKKLGLNPSKVTIVAPEIKDFQESKTYKITDKIAVPKNKGLLLIIK